MKSYETRDELEAEMPEGHVVCASLLKDGTPRYFSVPADTPDADVRAAAFEIREGRPLGSYEQFLIKAVTETKVA